MLLQTEYPTKVLTYELGFRDGRRDAIKKGGINIGPCSDSHSYLNGYHAGFIYQDHITGIHWQQYGRNST